MRKIFLDCGGHCGCSRRYFRNNYDRKKEFEIFSFEPDPELNQYCPHFINKAVWVENTVKDFHKFEMRGGSSLYKCRADLLQKQPIYSNIRTLIHVECFDLDEYIKTNENKGIVLVDKYIIIC